MFLFTICMYLFISFTLEESCIVALTAFFPFWSVIQKDWWKFCLFLLICYIIPLFPLSCPRAPCADPNGQVGIQRQGWQTREFLELSPLVAMRFFLRNQGMSLTCKVVEKTSSSLLSKIWCLPVLGSCWAFHVSALTGATGFLGLSWYSSHLCSDTTTALSSQVSVLTSYSFLRAVVPPNPCASAPQHALHQNAFCCVPFLKRIKSPIMLPFPNILWCWWLLLIPAFYLSLFLFCY